VPRHQARSSGLEHADITALQRIEPGLGVKIDNTAVLRIRGILLEAFNIQFAPFCFDVNINRV
jgi:hypothetical protein